MVIHEPRAIEPEDKPDLTRPIAGQPSLSENAGNKAEMEEDDSSLPELSREPGLDGDVYGR